MKGLSVSEVVRDYKIILKYLKKLPSSTVPNEAGTSPLQMIKTMYKEGKLETDEKKMASMREAAHSYAVMTSSIDKLRFLRGLDSGEKLDPRDKIRATARRVGLGVPDFADERMKHYFG